MSKNKKETPHIGTVEDYNYSLGYGTIDSDGQKIIFTYKHLPIKDGKFIIPTKGQQVSFSTEKDNFYGTIATNIKIIN